MRVITKLKQFFCNHDYKLTATRQSDYIGDRITFSDCGCYDDYLYECTKCKKHKIVIKRNKKHPLYNEWRKVKNESNDQPTNER